MINSRVHRLSSGRLEAPTKSPVLICQFLQGRDVLAYSAGKYRQSSFPALEPLAELDVDPSQGQIHDLRGPQDEMAVYIHGNTLFIGDSRYQFYSTAVTGMTIQAMNTSLMGQVAEKYRDNFDLHPHQLARGTGSSLYILQMNRLAHALVNLLVPEKKITLYEIDLARPTQLRRVKIPPVSQTINAQHQVIEMASEFLFDSIQASPITNIVLLTYRYPNHSVLHRWDRTTNQIISMVFDKSVQGHLDPLYGQVYYSFTYSNPHLYRWDGSIALSAPRPDDTISECHISLAGQVILRVNPIEGHTTEQYLYL